MSLDTDQLKKLARESLLLEVRVVANRSSTSLIMRDVSLAACPVCACCRAPCVGTVPKREKV